MRDSTQRHIYIFYINFHFNCSSPVVRTTATQPPGGRSTRYDRRGEYSRPLYHIRQVYEHTVIRRIWYRITDVLLSICRSFFLMFMGFITFGDNIGTPLMIADPWQKMGWRDEAILVEWWMLSSLSVGSLVAKDGMIVDLWRAGVRSYALVWPAVVEAIRQASKYREKKKIKYGIPKNYGLYTIVSLWDQMAICEAFANERRQAIFFI